MTSTHASTNAQNNGRPTAYAESDRPDTETAPSIEPTAEPSDEHLPEDEHFLACLT